MKSSINSPWGSQISNWSCRKMKSEKLCKIENYVCQSLRMRERAKFNKRKLDLLKAYNLLSNIKFPLGPFTILRYLSNAYENGHCIYANILPESLLKNFRRILPVWNIVANLLYRFCLTNKSGLFSMTRFFTSFLFLIPKDMVPIFWKIKALLIWLELKYSGI